MTQNIYDDPEFFASYSQLPRSVEGLDGAAEWPVLRTLLPDPHGISVVDLGCGFGWFCRWVRAQGAARVLGLDVSANMLARGRAETSDPGISYSQADLEQLDLPEAAFGLAYASLVFHYIADLERLFATIHGALTPDGHLVFSVEHPIFTAPARPGWISDPQGERIWPLNRYLIQGPRRTDWLAKGVIKQHRTVADYVNALIRCGFAIARIEEWGPDEAQIAVHPEWAAERDRPPFLLISAQSRRRAPGRPAARQM